MNASTLAGTPAQEKAPARASNTEPGKNQEHPQNNTEAADGKPLDSPAIGLYKNATATKQCADLTLEELVEAIRGDEFEPQIKKMRAILAAGDEDGYSVAKKDLMAVSISAVVEGRRAKAAEEGRMIHTGFIQVDLDGRDNIGWTVEEMRDELISDEHIQAVFVTPSGEGVKGLFRISPVPAGVDLVAQHKHAFAQVSKRFEEKNLTIDGACCDPVRLAFVSHDPEAWLREEEATPMVIDPLPPQTDRRQQEATQPLAKPQVNTGSQEHLIIRSKHGGFPEPPQHGIHTWLMRAAWWCRFHDMTEADTVAMLQSYDNGQLRRPLQPTEAVDAAREVFSTPLPSPVTVDPRQHTIINLGKEAISDGKATSHDDCRAILAERAFDAATVPQRPIPILLLGEKVISTPGNLTNIQAPAKAGKSAVIGAIIAAMFNGNRQGADTLGFSADNCEGGAVLHFDTEQSRFDHDGLIRRAMTRARVDTPPPWFRSYCITDLSTDQRQQAISYAVEDAAAAHGGIFSIIIDGVADICRDPNNPEEAFGLVDGLHAGAIKHDCAIITVLHENPGSETGKMRGHLGSQLERKAETPLRLAKDPGSGITTIWTDRARHCHIPKDKGTCFSWSDTQGMHVSRGSAGEIKATEKRQKFFEEAAAAFGDAASLSYSALVAAIMQATGLKSDKTAEKRITTYQAEGIISKTPGGSYSLKS